MKTYIKLITSFLFTILILSSCSTDIDEIVAKPLVNPEKVNVDNNDPFVCTDENGKESAFTFSWSAADFGANISCEYVLLFDTEGNNFSNQVELTAGINVLKKVVTSTELNTIMHARGLPIETPTNLEVKVLARPMTIGAADPALPVAISTSKVSVNVTSYVRPGVHIIGSPFDEYLNGDKFFWVPTNYQYIMFRDNPLDVTEVYTAYYLNFTGNGLRGEMAFLEDTKLGTWTTINKDIEGTLKYSGSNIKLDNEGYQTVKINLDLMTYSIEAYDASGAPSYTSVKLTGAGVSEEVVMQKTHYDPHIWIADDVELTVGEVAFSLDGSTWGSDTYPYGKATKDGGSIGIQKQAKFFVKYNDLTGHYVFYKKQ